jgi:hypothetical protein
LFKRLAAAGPAAIDSKGEINVAVAGRVVEITPLLPDESGPRLPDLISSVAA